MLFLRQPGAVAARAGVGGAARGRTGRVVHGAQPGAAEARRRSPSGPGSRGWPARSTPSSQTHHRQPAGVRLQPLDDHALLRHPRRARQPAGRAARRVPADRLRPHPHAASSTTEFQKEWSRDVPRVDAGKQYLKVSGWRLIIFGLVLILMMRFRPEGLAARGAAQARTAPGSRRGRRDRGRARSRPANVAMPRIRSTDGRPRPSKS